MTICMEAVWAKKEWGGGGKRKKNPREGRGGVGGEWRKTVYKPGIDSSIILMINKRNAN